MVNKLKKHKDKVLILLAFISGGGLSQISDFMFDVKQVFNSESKKQTASQIDGGDFKNEIRYVEKDFQLTNNLQKAGLSKTK